MIKTALKVRDFMEMQRTRTVLRFKRIVVHTHAHGAFQLKDVNGVFFKGQENLSPVEELHLE